MTDFSDHILVPSPEGSIALNVHRARQTNHRLLTHLRIARKPNVQMSETFAGQFAAKLRGERDAFMFVAKSEKAKLNAAEPLTYQQVKARVIEELVAEVERLRADDWQPIETAPKDWSSVLLHPSPEGGNDETVIGWYCPDEDDYGWYTTEVLPSGDVGRVEFDPTHWKPLPNAPEVKE